MPARTLIAGGGKSMPGFKVSKNRLTLSLGANSAGDLKSKPVLVDCSGNPRALRNYAKPTLPVLSKWSSKACVAALPVAAWFPEYFKSTVETHRSEKNIFKI